MKALRVCMGHFTLYTENCVGKEREIKSDRERRKLLFHISSTHSFLLSPADALGGGLLNSCFSLVSLVASESADQLPHRMHCSPFTPPASPLYLDMCFIVLSSGPAFHYPRDKLGYFAIWQRGDIFLHCSEKQSPSTSLHCLKAGGSSWRGLCLFLSFLR